MQKAKLIIALFFTLCTIVVKSSGQTKPKKQANKPDINKQIEEANKEMQEVLKNMTPEERKMMVQAMGGQKLPTKIEIPKGAEKQIAEAMEDADRIVPKKDVKRISTIKPISEDGMKVHIENIMAEIDKKLDAKYVMAAKKIMEGKSVKDLYHIGYMLWLSGNPELGLYIMSKYMANQKNTSEAINTFSAMLIMSGGEQWAIPMLENIAKKYPTNSTILNNLAQAWFGLGEIEKANNYILACTKQVPNHSQANATKAKICESKGDKAGALAALEKSMDNGFSQDKKRDLEKLSGKRIKYPIMKLPKTDFNLGLTEFVPQKFPKTYAESQMLEPYNEEIKAHYNAVLKKLEQLGRENSKVLEAEMKQLGEDARKGNFSKLYAMSPFKEYASKLEYQNTQEFVEKYKRFEEKIVKLREQAAIAKKTLNDILDNSQKEEAKHLQQMQSCSNCCKTRIAAWNDYLLKVNGPLEDLYIEFLTDLKASLNDRAYYAMLAAPNERMSKQSIMNARGMWIGHLASMPIEYADPISANGYLCQEEKEDNEKFKKPRDFDDVACDLNVSFEMPLTGWSFSINCKGTKLNINGGLKIGNLDASLPFSYEYSSDFKSGQSTHQIGFSKSAKIIEHELKTDKLPFSLESELKVEGKATIYIETDKKGVSDIGVVAKAGATAGSGIGEEISKADVGVGSIDIATVEIKVGFNAGHSGNIKSILGGTSWSGK